MITESLSERLYDLNARLYQVHDACNYLQHGNDEDNPLNGPISLVVRELRAIAEEFEQVHTQLKGKGGEA